MGSMPNVAVMSQKDPLQDSHSSQSTAVHMQRTLSARTRREGGRQSMPNVATKSSKEPTQGSPHTTEMQRTLSARTRREGGRRNMPSVAVKSQKAPTQYSLASHSKSEMDTLPARERKEGSRHSTPSIAAKSQRAPVQDSHHTSHSAMDTDTEQMSTHSRSETRFEHRLGSLKLGVTSESRLTGSSGTGAGPILLGRTVGGLDPRRTGSYKFTRRKMEGVVVGGGASPAGKWQRSHSDSRPQRSTSDSWKTERSDTLV